MISFHYTEKVVNNSLKDFLCWNNWWITLTKMIFRRGREGVNPILRYMWPALKFSLRFVHLSPLFICLSFAWLWTFNISYYSKTDVRIHFQQNFEKNILLWKLTEIKCHITSTWASFWMRCWSILILLPKIVYCSELLLWWAMWPLRLLF